MSCKFFSAILTTFFCLFSLKKIDVTALLDRPRLDCSLHTINI
jgi:hypothetical protein